MGFLILNSQLTVSYSETSRRIPNQAPKFSTIFSNTALSDFYIVLA